MKKSKIFLLAFVIFIDLAFCFLALAWTEPSLPPPQGNVPAPINVSGEGQVKLYEDDTHKGWLGIATDGYDPSYGLTVGNSTNQLGIKTSGDSYFEGDLTIRGNLKLNNVADNIYFEAKNSTSQVVIGFTGPYGSQSHERLHISSGSAGGANWYDFTVLGIEDNDHAYINIRTPNDKYGGIIFSDPDGSYSGSINYDHSTDEMSFTSEKSISFLTAGNTAFVIDSSGNVGIGISSPTEKLEVNGAIKIGNTTNTNAGTIRWTGSDFEGYTGTDWVSLTAGTGGATTFLQLTDTPSSYSGYGGYVVKVKADETGLEFGTVTGGTSYWTQSGTSLYPNDASWDVGIGLAGTDSNYRLTVEDKGIKITNTGTHHSLYVEDQNNDTTPFVIDSSGNVGIGTDSPSYKLDVSGNVNGTQLCIAGDCRSSWPSEGIQGSISTGQVAFGTGSDTIGGDDGLYWDNTNKRLGIGTTSPNNLIQVADLINFDNSIYGTFLGYQAGGSTSEVYNTAVGYKSLYSNTSGRSNVAVGGYALYSNTTGQTNVGVGLDALYSNTTGRDNSAVGQSALYYNNGSYNSAMGAYALQDNISGSYNSAMGAHALFHNTTGSKNTALGFNAGAYTESFTYNKTSNNSVYIGYNTKAKADGDTNEIVIGASAIGNGSNSVTLGNDSITKTILKGNVGIGTNSPSYKLDIIDNRDTDYVLRVQHTVTGGNTVDQAAIYGYISDSGIGGNDYAILGEVNITSSFPFAAAIAGKVSTEQYGSVYAGYFWGPVRIIKYNDPGKAVLIKDGYIRFSPQSSAGTCNANMAGAIYFDSDDKHFYGCNGMNWVRLDYNP